MFGWKKRKKSDSSQDKEREEIRDQLLYSLDAGIEYYHTHPEEIDFVIKYCPLFYTNYLQNNWRDKWYCKTCKQWHPMDMQTCKCGQWQAENLRVEALLQEGNEKVDKCFSLLKNKFGRPFPYMILNNGTDDCVYNKLTTALYSVEFNSDNTLLKPVLNEFKAAILAHLGLEKTPVLLTFETENGVVSNGLTGHFSNNIVDRIHIKINLSYPTDTVIAILCHEFTHLFLDKHNLRYDDEAYNEMLTDAAAVFLGFGRYIWIGYSEYNSYSWSTNESTKYRVGYLPKEDYDYACALYRKMRDDELTIQRAALQEVSTRLEASLKYNISLYEASQQKLINKPIDQRAFQLLQENSLFIENGECRETLQKAKSSGLRPDISVESVEALIKKITLLTEKCAVFNRNLNFLLQQYSVLQRLI